MKLTFSSIKIRATLLTLCCGVVAACGGSSSGDSGSNAPDSLFPHGVRNGTAVFGSDKQLVLHISFRSSDVTMGAGYTGNIVLPTTADEETTGSTETISFSGENMRQVDESTPGRLVFMFDATAQPQALEGKLVLLISDGSSNDAQNTRIATVEGSTDLLFNRDMGQVRTRLDLSDLTVTITWQSGDSVSASAEQ